MISPTEIECMASEIIDAIKEHGYEDIAVYYNGKRTCINYDGIRTEEADPHDYFEFCGDILSMSFEGELYHDYNDRSFEGPKWLTKIWEKRGLYAELGDAWNLSLYE